MTGPWQGQGCERSSNPCGITRPVEVKVCGDRHACNSEAMNKYTSDLTLYFYITLLLFTQKQKAYEEIYYEGDDTNEAGWYYDDIYISVNEDGTLTTEIWLVRVLSGGQYDGYSLTPYWLPGGTFTPSEAPKAVELPAGVELKEYSLSGTDYSGNPYSSSAFIGIDGNDVYLQGYSSYIPEALIKGTKEDDTVTFPGGQFLGSYAGYNSYFVEEAVFTYDETNDTYTASGDVYALLDNRYIDVWTTDPVLKGVVEKAATPANPAITALTNSQYGYYISFNVPNVDTNGEGLASSKLFYEIFTDIEHEVNPLTFTPTTHTYLTEDLTIIPFGFSEHRLLPNSILTRMCMQ